MAGSGGASSRCGDRSIAVAHVRQGEDHRWESHGLAAHLRAVSTHAGDFAAPFAPREWAELAGLWHDLGKYRPGFQSYIRSVAGLAANDEAAPGRIKHAIVGAVHATESCGPYGRLLAYLIAGHHAGLPDWYPDEAGGSPLSQALLDDAPALAEAKAGGVPEDLLSRVDLPRPPITEASEVHLWLRMLFSAVVDADFLDTERFMDAGRGELRGGFPSIAALSDAYDRYMVERFAHAATTVHALRSQVQADCLAKAAENPGLFSLTVPTGGAKTLASLGFALHHALQHQLKRVIYVIPYTSIIEQTADAFRDVFAHLQPDPVVEHHHNLDPDRETTASRLATENWDAPVVVTTNVQFFESLYAARPSRCRKLHNICESVVVLDEAQLLPPEQLRPILDALRQLIDRYRVSVVLSTATQPELGKTRTDAFGRVQLQGLGEARELASDPPALFSALQRVTMRWPESPRDRRSWDEIAASMQQHDKVLCIVNRRDDAEALWRRLPDGALHLSARMCAAHRSRVITDIRKLLADDAPVRVVSTQLVEAGVDLDFPVVFRAMAGLDSIAQAAGRCNREGRLPERGGLLEVVNPPRPSPSGLLLKAEQASQRVLLQHPGEALMPSAFARYFDAFYSDVNSHDASNVTALLGAGAANGEIQFRTAARRFQLIPEQEQQPVFVTWEKGAQLIRHLRSEGPHRLLMRRLQRYTVTLHADQASELIADGRLERLPDGFVVQIADEAYHPELGLLPKQHAIDPASLVI